METARVIYARRSVRKFKTDPIPLDQVEFLLDAAQQAPSWMNSQSPRYFVINNRELIDKLADESCQGRRSLNILKTAPCAIFVCALPGNCGKGAATRDGKIPEWFMFDSALAVENLCLAATDRGIGSLIIGGYDPDIARKVIGIPDEMIPVCLIALGYPDEDPVAPPRLSKKDVVRVNGPAEAWK
jgi:nitroreductase